MHLAEHRRSAARLPLQAPTSPSADSPPSRQLVRTELVIAEVPTYRSLVNRRAVNASQLDQNTRDGHDVLIPFYFVAAAERNLELVWTLYVK